MSMFVEEVKYNKIKQVVNGHTWDGALISVVPYGEMQPPNISIVIGAAWGDQSSSYFSKKGLRLLIADLQAIHEAMG